MSLSYLFLLPVVILCLSAAVYSPGYLKGHGDEHAGCYWTFFTIMAASMLSVALSRSALTFLVSWELMGFSSAVLVGFDKNSRETPRALWIYLAACQGGAAFLMLMFAGQAAGWLSAVPVFILAVLGFGLKAGFPGLHVWLPEAHPAAPAPVSAVMSGAMINLGLYGILVFAVGAPSLSYVYGITFLCLGIIGSLGGISFALGQRNLKTMLAFSSIENMGIISMGLGFGFLGLYSGIRMMTLCGFVGAFFHMLNHAILKGGLFLCAGAVLKSTHTLDMDRLGGLIKKMPVIGTFFILNSIGISGLPPFNGFISEFLIYAAAFSGIISGFGLLFVLSIAGALSLALVGGLAVAAFSKAAGSVFLGAPRSSSVSEAKEIPQSMFFPICALFGLSFAMVVFAPAIFYILSEGGVMDSVLQLSGFSNGEYFNEIRTMLRPIGVISAVSGTVIFLTVLLMFVRRVLLPKGEIVSTGPTWDCGYAAPTARMEYTATAFTQPLVDFLDFILRPIRKIKCPGNLFPPQDGASIDVSVEDAGIRALWRPVFSYVSDLAERLHALQSGYLHLYILAMVVATAAMLIFAFCF